MAFQRVMRKMAVIFFAISVGSFQLTAQHRKLQNLPYVDNKVIHFGFTVGFHTQDLLLTQSGSENEDGEVWFSEIPNYSPGFSVGLIADLYLSHFVNLRLIPTIHLGSKDFVFKEQTSGEEFKTGIRNNYVTLPLQLKFNGGRIDNYRPYVIAGGYGSLEVASRKNQPVLLKPYDFGIEVGFGCDFYLPYFKLSPELKFTFGLTDVLEQNRDDLVNRELMKYSQSLSKAVQRMIVLSFNFE